jgi:hypothetical protein
VARRLGSRKASCRGVLPALVLVGLAACGSPRTTSTLPPPEAEHAPVASSVDVERSEEPGGARCWSESRDLARVEDPRLTEISGMVASRRDPGLLFVHNDSGEAVARYFAIRTDGTTVAEVIVDGAPSFDLEDAALEAREGREWIYLGDIGDNAARDGGRARGSIDVIRSEVPSFGPGSEALHVATHELYRFTYPDGPHDSEALIVDPTSGDLYVLSKENEGPHRVYRAAAPLVDGQTRMLEHVVDVLPGRSLADAVTAADVDAEGRFSVRTYRRVFLFAGGTTPVERWSVHPLELPVIREFQGESIAFSADGHTLYSLAEGEGETLHALTEGPCP